MPSRRGRGQAGIGPTIEALFGGLLGFMPGYFFMESIFGLYPHPTHWVGGIIGIGGGYGLGALVAAHKEGRSPFGQGGERRPGPRERPGDAGRRGRR